LRKQYDTVSTTRFNQLERKIDKVKEEGLGVEEGEKRKLLEEG